MKLCKIAIKGFRQFQDVALDFTHPQTGAPLDKVCFIGRNGTGKSTILDTITSFLAASLLQGQIAGPSSLYAVQFQTPTGKIWRLTHSVFKIKSEQHVFLRGEIDEHHPNWIENVHKIETAFQVKELIRKYESWIVDNKNEIDKIIKENSLIDNSSDLLINCPPETQNNGYLTVTDVPKTNVSEALQLFKLFPFHHEISKSTVDSMWKTLVYLMKKRDGEWREFENKKDNAHRILNEIKEEFNREHPEILPKLAEFWNNILQQAGLEFDMEGASNPVQLTDNLHAYIRLKHGDKSRIPYAQLSSGIRNFIFTVGHIYLLYFGREIKRGFLLVDEPENSLFPDFLFDLMETYDGIVRNEKGETATQIFMATHNPIVAAQFEPFERIVLDWNDDGTVSARKGVAPKGDDPNDVLTKDFELTELMGKTGRDKWKQYLELKSKARRSKDNLETQMDLESKALDIAREYGFPAPTAK